MRDGTMEKKLHLYVVTQMSTVFDDDIEYANIPTTVGSVGILTGHAPMVCAVAKGNLKCRKPDGSGVVIELGGGIAEVSNNTVTVLVSDARISE